jgi:ribosome-binding factor A
MSSSLRQKKVASLVRQELSHLLLDFFHGEDAGPVSITRVDMTNDLKTAHVFLSIFENQKQDHLLKELDLRKGYFRKLIAAKIDLKYNPMLIFSLDPLFSIDEKLDNIFANVNSEKNKLNRTYKNDE